MAYQCNHVESEKEEEKEEEFVVTIAKAVIDECAVVIETLDTLVAVVAMSCVFWA